jgi:DNA-binding transcriptional ArsR family regulator
MSYQLALDALGDPTRRTILELLRSGELAVGEIAARLPVSRPAVSKHLRVLRRARLVSERRDGTRHFFSVDPAGVAELRAFFDSFWADALTNYAALAEQTAPPGEDL